MALNAKGITRAWSDESQNVGLDNRTQTVRYDAFGYDRSSEVLADPLCPDINDPLDEDPSLLVSAVRPDRKGLRFWHIFVTYSVPADGDQHPGKNGADKDDPTKKPTEWDWDDGLENEQFDRDADGTPITNSALDPLSSPANRTISTLAIIGYKWYRFFDVGRSQSFRNKTNSDDWRPAGRLFGGKTIPSGTARCTSIKPVGRLTANAKFVEVMHRFELREDGWKFRMMDVGRRMRAVANNVASTQPIVLVQPPKASITDDVRLDGKGRPLDNRSYEPLFGKVDPQNNVPFRGPEIEILPDAVFLKWKMLKQARFSDLAL